MNILLKMYDNLSDKLLSSILWPVSITLLWMFDRNDASDVRGDVTFIVGTFVSLLAAAHYIIQIIKGMKKKKTDKKE